MARLTTDARTVRSYTNFLCNFSEIIVTSIECGIAEQTYLITEFTIVKTRDIDIITATSYHNYINLDPGSAIALAIEKQIRQNIIAEDGRCNENYLGITHCSERYNNRDRLLELQTELFSGNVIFPSDRIEAEVLRSLELVASDELNLSTRQGKKLMSLARCIFEADQSYLRNQSPPTFVFS